MSDLFFTSDLHLNHFNCIKYCNRPFKDLDTMNNTIVKRWNDRVKPCDTVIHVGDFCFKNTPGGKAGEGGLEKADYWASKLNGRIVFIKGNHDRNNKVATHITSLVIDNKYYVTHRPQDFNLNFEINIVGHVHDSWMVQRITDSACRNVYLINVGVDQHNFYPLKLNEVLSIVAQFKRNEKK